MKNVFVAGKGTMGLDIAQVFATAGLDVKIYVRPQSAEGIDAVTAKLDKKLSKLVLKGRMEEAKKAEIMAKISFTNSYDDAKDFDLVMDSIAENMQQKEELFKKLDSICKKETIFATNTSSLSISEMASITSRPEQFIGMHFFNPATVMKLVEVIRGGKTDDATFKAVFELSEQIGKQPVEVKEAPGFVVNMLLVPMINNAIGLYQEGVASVEDIDKAMMLGANHPMGPLALGDFIGLDICLLIMDTIYNETGDSKYRASTLLRKMVRSGMLGKKSGKGFYDYSK